MMRYLPNGISTRAAVRYARNRSLVFALIALIVATPIVSTVAPLGQVNAASPEILIDGPRHVAVGEPITFSLAARGINNMAGYEALVLFDATAIEFSSFQRSGNGLQRDGRDTGSLTALVPSYGVAVGIYSCPATSCVDPSTPANASSEAGDMSLGSISLYGLRDAVVEVRFDALKVVDAGGNPLVVSTPHAAFTIVIGQPQNRHVVAAPISPWDISRVEYPAITGHDLTGDAQVTHADAMAVALDWTSMRERHVPCSVELGSTDVYLDRCIDIGDLQIEASLLSPSIATADTQQMPPYENKPNAFQALVAGAGTTYTVNSIGDESDLSQGDGICQISVPVNPRLKNATFESGNLTDPVTGVDTVTGGVQIESALPLRGAYSASIPNLANASLQETFSPAIDLYSSFYVRLRTLPRTNMRLAEVLNNGVVVGNLQLSTTGVLSLRSGTTSIGVASTPLATGIVYRLGIHQKTGTAGDGVLEGFLAVEDDAFGVPFAAMSTGAWTTAAGKVRVGALVSVALDAIVDNLLLDTVSMPTAGDIPPTPTGPCTLRAAIQEANAQAGANTIAFNIPGAGVQTITLGSELPSIFDGDLTIDGYTQPGSSPNTDPIISNATILVEIRGLGENEFSCFRVTSANNAIRGLSIYKCNHAVWIFGPGSHHNVLTGDFVGTNAAGTYGAPQLTTLAHGINIEQDSAHNRIGGTTPAERNVVSGNGQQGIALWHAHTDFNVIINNIIGLSPDAERSIPNQKHGVDVNHGSSDNLIENNLISGNHDSGIELSHDPLTTRNEVVGNRIGTDASGNGAPAYAGNEGRGIMIEDGARGNLISGNVIVNSGVVGIELRLTDVTGRSADANIVENNRIGITLNGTPGPNRAGLWINGVSNIIRNNVIAFNTFNGIKLELDSADFNTITRNQIYGNGAAGIEILPIGPNPNDLDDTDTGPNEGLNYPVLERVITSEVNGTACAGCLVELYAADGTVGQYGQGISFVGDGIANTAGAFIIALSGVNVDDVLTATATDPAGNTSEFAVNALVLPPPPAAPTDLRVTGTSAFQIALAWTDTADYEDGFTLERSPDDTFATTTDIALAANATTFADSGLTPDTTYYYRIKAMNVSGPSPYSNSISATTLMAPPAAPSDLTAAATSTTNIDLTWSDNTTTEASYSLERSTTVTFSAVTVLTLPADTTSYSDAALVSGTRYYYRVHAVNAGGDSGLSNVASAQTYNPPPAAPTDLRVTGTSAFQIALAWTDTATNETGYTIERSPNGSDWSVLSTALIANRTTYNDTQVQPNATYYYRVMATNVDGHSAYSNVASGTSSSRLKDITFENGSLTHPISGVDQVSGTIAVETTAPLKGSDSARIMNASSYLDEGIVATDDLYVSIYIRLVARPSASLRLVDITNNGTIVGNIQLTKDGRLNLRNNNSVIGSASIPLVVGNVYRIGIHQKRGQGANGVLEAFVVAGDLSFGAPFATTASGTWKTAATRIRIGATVNVVLKAIVDDIRIDAAVMPQPS